MNNLQTALESIKREDEHAPFIEAIECYLASGNESLLSKISNAKPLFSRWADALPPEISNPCDLTLTEHRLLDILVVTREYGILIKWYIYFQSNSGCEIALNFFQELINRKICLSDFADHLLHRATHDIMLGFFRILPKEALNRLMYERSWFAVFYLPSFLIEHVTSRLEDFIECLLDVKVINFNISCLLTKEHSRHFESKIVNAFKLSKDIYHRFLLVKMLYASDSAKFANEALLVSKDLLRKRIADKISKETLRLAGAEESQWILQTFGLTLLPDITAHVLNVEEWLSCSIIEATVKSIGKESRPMLYAVLRDRKNSFSSRQLLALDKLGQFEDCSGSEPEIESYFKEAFQQKDAKFLLELIPLAIRWNKTHFTEIFWELLQHKSKVIGKAVMRTLSELGEGAIPRIIEILKNRNAEIRITAVELLSLLDSFQALKSLEAHLEKETNQSVRDEAYKAIDKALLASGKQISLEELDSRIKRSANKLKNPVADWLTEDLLPPLYFRDETLVPLETVRYLLYRQSRTSDIRADSESRPFFAYICRERSGDFALNVLNAFLASEQKAVDRWALALAALLGDDRLVPIIMKQIRIWIDAKRGKLAEYASSALALLGTDVALLSVDTLATRYRSKQKNVGRAASEAYTAVAKMRGLTADQLGDYIMPWLGFEPNKPRIITCGKTTVEVSIGLDFKLAFFDLTKNKKLSSLPSSASAEIKTEIKELTEILKETVKGQLLRIENLMVCENSWTTTRWAELFLSYPILLPFGVRLVWGLYGNSGKLMQTFRALADRTLTTVDDDPLELPSEGSISLIHPLRIEEQLRQSWLKHLIDYEIKSPFTQLERPVSVVTPEQESQKFLTTFSNTKLNAMTFIGRAQKRNWARGSVGDGGCVASYSKSFPAANVDAFLLLDEMFAGVTMDSEVTLQQVFFVHHKSVSLSSCYEEPTKESDPRLIPFGQVPRIPFSEVLWDLEQISGIKGSTPTDS